MSTCALILAGGRSRRMGLDKLSLPWGEGDVTVIEHVLRTVATVVDDVRVLAPPAVLAEGRRWPQFVRVERDVNAHLGPLAALASGWPVESDEVDRPDEANAADEADKLDERDQPDEVLVIAGDLPGLTPQVLRSCQRGLQTAPPDADGACVWRDNQMQPLLGCYRFAAGRAWLEAVQAGETRLMRAVAGLRMVAVDADAAAWPMWWTRPLHTPQDYTDWLRWSHGGDRQTDA